MKGLESSLARKGRSRELAIYGVLFLTLLVIALWLGVDLTDGRDRIIAERTEIAIQKSQFMSQWFGTTLLTTDYVIRGINDKVDASSLADAGPERITTLSAWLAQKMASIPDVAGLGIYDANCVFVASADSQRNGFRSNTRDCVERPPKFEDKLHIQYMPTQKSASKRPVILLTRHQISPDGQLRGGTLAVIDLEFAQQWLNTFAVGAHDVLAVVDTDGTLLARNPPLPEAIGKRAPTPDSQPRFGEDRFSAGFLALSPLDGRRLIFGMSKIEHIPIEVIVGFDLASTLAEWQRRAWQLTGGYVALVLLSLLVLREHLTALGQREEMRHLAATDALTGVANRRHFVETGTNEVRRALRYGNKLAVLMVDIDHFKVINDSWGHPTGDRVIQALAEAMVASVRDQDRVGRLGGEEFAILLPETDWDGASLLAERLRSVIQEAKAVTAADGTIVRFTISIGVTVIADAKSFEDLMGRADRALYQAKEGGRNRVVMG